MPIDIYDKDFQNWLKGVLALNTTRQVLCKIICDGLRKFISELPDKSHLPQFLCCLKENGVTQLKPKKSDGKNIPYAYGCRHEQCKTLFERFFDQHREMGKQVLKWEIFLDQEGINECKPNTGDEDNMLWQISRLYMFADKGESVTEYKSLDDLDISNVIKTMRSCKLFYPDGSLQLYSELSDFRNDLMHSPNNKVTEDYLKQNLGKAIELIRLLSTNQNQTDALQYLQKIGEKDFEISFQSDEYKWVLVEVKKAEKIAVTLQTDDERNKADLKTIQEILKRITDSGPTDISKQLVGKASEFKELVKNCIEKKKKSIELDKATCSQEDDTAHKAEELEKLQQQVERDLIEINQRLKKTDKEEVADLIDNLSKENKNLKTERKEATRVKDDLVNENRKLREENRHKQHEVRQYSAELQRYRKEQERTKTKQDIPETQTANYTVDIYTRRKNNQRERVERYRANLNDSVRFYMKEVRMKPEGLLIDKLHVEWWGEIEILEEHSEYIYWLFPVKTINLNKHDEKQQLQKIKKFQKDKIAMKRLLISYKMMLNFYGMMLENEYDGTIQRAENWRDRFEHLNKSAKNKLRIERIMECLGQFGYGHLQENFMRFLRTEGLLEETFPT